MLRLFTTALSLLSAAVIAAGAEAQSTGSSTLGAAVGGSNHGAVAPETPPSVRDLRDDIGLLLQRAGAADARFSVMVASLDRGDTLFSHAPDLPLAPASNMKLYSTAAALYYLGPLFRYSTHLLVSGEVREGVLHGDVVLRGTGDPSISGRLLRDPLLPLQKMAAALEEQGIHTVAGDVIGDGSWFDDEWVGSAWEEDDRMSWYAAPVGGLTFGENMTRVRVAPGASAGQPARIDTEPKTSGLALRNEVRTVTGGRGRITFHHGPDSIVVRGTIGAGSRMVERRMPVVDPANHAAAVLRAVMEARGITVLGRTRSGVAREGEGRVVAEHVSPSLLELATVTNHVSHNLYAEALLKTVGRAVGRAGSFTAGGAAVQSFLALETGADTAAVRVVDGSGLSRPNRATARATIGLLAYLSGSEIADAFTGSLPVAGSARGLRRMYGTPAAGNLRAKTGTIRRVSALSGYVTAANGERLAFSIISNGIPESWRAKALEDAIATRLATFSR